VDINQTVNYKATITVQKGAENYVLHDKMDAGLDFISVSGVKTVQAGVTEENYPAVLAENYTVRIKGSEGFCNDCTFEVAFDNAYIAKLPVGTQIVVYYSANLNQNAVVAGDGNDNTVVLKYGDSNTVEAKTTTYTWDMNVLKYGDGDKEKVLAGAEFVLLNSQKDKVATIVNGKLTGWVDVPAADEEGNISWPDNTTLTTNDAGKIAIEGLDADTYHLREIKAPDGYNKLNQDTDVTVTRQVSTDGKTMTYTKVTSEINNQSGAELPSTGGIGTTIFYVVGGALVLGAAVLLVTRRRMAE
jgi:fimbrial isopeptide formation D2 family protein/LPXTG-motif cell wall-anchored protein